MDLKSGLSAIRKFQDKVKDDVRWLELLSQLDPQNVQEHPEAVMVLLTDGFGLYELDAIEVVLRLCEQAREQVAARMVN